MPMKKKPTQEGACSPRVLAALESDAAVVAGFDDLPDGSYIRQRHLVPDRKYPQRPALLQVSASTFWRWIAEGKFPKQTNFGRTACWRVGDVRSWMAEQRKEGER